MRKLMSVLLAIVFAGALASAEVVPERELMASDGAAALVSFLPDIVDAQDITTDENAKAGYGYCINSIVTIQQALMEAINAEPEFILQEDRGEMIVRDEQFGTFEGGGWFSTQIMWLEALGAYGNVGVSWRDGYVRGTITVYYPDGELLGNQIIEVGKRDDGSMILLLIDVDPETMATGRVALKCENGDSEVIFTKTLGSHYHFRLDVNAWQQGEDYGVWDRRQLLPVQ